MPNGPEGPSECHWLGRPFTALLWQMPEYVCGTAVAKETGSRYALECEAEARLPDWRHHSARMDACAFNRETPAHHVAEPRVRARRLRVGRAERAASEAVGRKPTGQRVGSLRAKEAGAYGPPG